MSSRPLRSIVLVLLVAACGGPATAASPGPATELGSAIASVPATMQPTVAASATVAPAADLTGTLVFHRYDMDTHPHIWTSCADRTKLTQLPDRAGYSTGWPTWSPDGQRIAFNANWEDPDLTDDIEIWDIYTMDREGGDVVRLTRSTGLEGDPGWSPDGTLIAFDSTEAGRAGIWVMNSANGKQQRLVTASPEGIDQDYAPRFSPDGQQLVFTRQERATESALWIVNLDGTGLRRLTPASRFPEKADWSPVEGLIVFGDTVEGSTLSTVWTIAPDGSGLTNVTATPSQPGAQDGYSHPVFSPDGSHILVVHGLHPGPYRHGLALMGSDGSDLEWIGPEAEPRFEKLLDWTATPC